MKLLTLKFLVLLVVLFIPNSVNSKELNGLKNLVIYEDQKKISEILKPKEVVAEVKIIYQSIEDLHISCPNHKGDWYFTGDYPTPGGNKVVTKAFINFIEGDKSRAY